MISARQMIEEVSRFLVDDEAGYEFVHWTETELLDYFRLAVEIVASTQKDKFIKRISVPLVSGQIQDVPEQCHDEPRILGQIDANGKVVAFPRRSSTTGLFLNGRVGCVDCAATSTSGDYVVESWGMDASNPNVLYVEPPVPDGVSATLEISCFVPPSIDADSSEVDLGSHLRPAIFHFMASYAYARDTESVPARDRATTHWNQAMQLLGSDKSNQLSNRYASTRTPELRLGASK